MVLRAAQNGEVPTTETRHIGPALLFGRLWKQIGIDQVINDLVADRKFEFDMERVLFTSVLGRLMNPGSDRNCYEWMQHQDIDGSEAIDLHHFYRAMSWLGEVTDVDPEKQFPFSTTTVKDEVEKRLFDRRKDLFTDLSMVFVDTTSISFFGQGGETLGEHGFSKDHRPDLRQMIVGIVLDNNGTPVCSMQLPGNTSDTTTLIPVVDKLRERFGIGDVCVVADRGMISQDNKKALTDAGIDYLLGVRMKLIKEVKEDVLSWPGRYREVRGPRQTSKDPAPLKVKEVNKDGTRYILCLNEQEARQEKQKRDAILEDLEQKLANGSDKQLVGNKGYKRYLQEPEEDGFKIDKQKVKKEARYDGKWVLETTTDLEPEEVALKYKQLWDVEQVFDQMKNTLNTRPIYHQTDEAIRGHVFTSFLALLLRKRLEDHLQNESVQIEWKTFKQDLDELQEMQVEKGDTEFIVRTDTKGKVGKVLQAVGVQPPKKIRKAESND
jgi:transposase